ncbi:hypothetical protein KBC85_03135 [Candidatus Saccharibacteria bacterium]|nr:hypothetical protein [Candidatus Saccharibacteria bacterium]
MNTPTKYSERTRQEDVLGLLGSPLQVLHAIATDETLYHNHLSYPTPDGCQELFLSGFWGPQDEPATWITYRSSSTGYMSDPKIISGDNTYTHYHESFARVTPAMTAVLSCIAQTDPNTLLTTDVSRETLDGIDPVYSQGGNVSLFIGPNTQIPQDILNGLYNIPKLLATDKIDQPDASILLAYESIGVFDQKAILQKIQGLGLNEELRKRFELTIILLESSHQDNTLSYPYINMLLFEGVKPFTVEDLLVTVEKLVQRFYGDSHDQHSLDEDR